VFYGNRPFYEGVEAIANKFPQVKNLPTLTIGWADAIAPHPVSSANWVIDKNE
jgi:hypothetical protein